MALTVLIVDDSAVMRAMIAKSLQMAGLPLGTIIQAANGEEGLRALGEHPVDLATVDLNMPFMDGEAMLAAMRDHQAGGQVPVIVVSAEGSHTRINRLLGAGVKFIRKPFAPESIRDAVHALLEAA